MIRYHKINVLIVTWNRKESLIRCVESVLAQTYKDLEIVIVDNNSTDGTSSLVKEKYPNIRLIRTAYNLGCPSARNLGFANCDSKFIYCLDDDGWLERDALKIAMDRALSDNDIAVVQSQVVYSSDNSAITKDCKDPMYVNCFSGGCSLIKREAIERVGYYPEDFFRQAEEEDLALSLLEAGWFCFFEPASIMFHSPSMVGRSRNMNYKYTLCNTLKIGLRRWPFPWNILRMLSIFYFAIKYSLREGYFSLPIVVLISCVNTLSTLKKNRKPIKLDVYKTYVELKKNPSIIKPILNFDKYDE